MKSGGEGLGIRERDIEKRVKNENGGEEFLQIEFQFR
jgi:hypothetical protein